MMNWEEAKTYAPVVLRLGLVAVFLWFGINQIIDPNNFVGYLPDMLFSSPQAGLFIITNGIIEIILAVLLAIGWRVRLIAGILALHLLSISIHLGINQTAIRDFGLTIALISITLHGQDKWCKVK